MDANVSEKIHSYPENINFFKCPFFRVSAQINSQTFQPRPHHPQNGSLHIDVDMSPMASPNHDNRLLGRRGLELTSFLEALYRDSECIDFESLCIKEGELAVELK